jgi:translation initiation factor 1 (eIF-1/SUI1)
METIPGMKLKEASKAFSKRFAGSSSVKEKEIIIQGDHSYDVAEMIISKFGVSEEAVYFDLDGEFVPYSG